MSNMIPFSISFDFETHPICVLNQRGIPWFVAKDVAEALGCPWRGNNTITYIPEEWRGVYSVQTPSGVHEMAILSEPGLRLFVIRSNATSKAFPFWAWIASEVLPAIRIIGSYSATDPRPGGA